MERHLFSRLLMHGPAREARNSIAATVETYRERGVFGRWPVEYVGRGPMALKRLGAALAHHGRVVLHVHVASGADFVASVPFMALGMAAGCPVLLHLHGGDLRVFHEAASGPSRALLEFFLQRAAGVLVPCEAMRAWIHGIARRAEVACLPPPVAAQAPVAGAERQPMVLFLGGLEAEKGVFDLMDAVAGLRAEMPEVRLVCAGEGRRARLLKYAEHLGMAENVKLTGWVGPSGKRALLESAAVYARPAYEDGLPVSLLEAMAAGVPVIASPVGGIPEVVSDGVTGLLVGPGDTASLQRLLRKVLTDAAFSERIARAARESVRLRFAPERTVSRLEEVYAGLGLTAQAEKPAARASRMKEAA